MTHGNSSALRLQAVEKAVGALKEGGLLCIVTPDSCHQVFLSFQKTFCFSPEVENIRYDKIEIDKSKYSFKARNSEQLSSWKFGLGLMGLSKVICVPVSFFKLLFFYFWFHC